MLSHVPVQAAGYAVPALNAPLNIDREAYDEVIHKAEEFIVRRFLSKFPQVRRRLDRPTEASPLSASAL